MQPMMVVSSGGPLPDLAIVVFARWIWRYRSELAPLGVALLVACLGWYAHAALPAGAFELGTPPLDVGVPPRPLLNATHYQVIPASV